MATVATLPVTAENFAAFVARPENADRWFELERGEIIELPPPKKPHGNVCGNIARFLGNYAVATGAGYVTANDAGYITERSPDSVRGPDVAYWNDTEVVAASDPEYTETPPIVAVEVLSPDDRINRVNRKIGEYLKSGVLEVWIIDPAARDIAIHRAETAPLFLSERDELDGGLILPGFRCPVAELFHALAPGT
jgi:Uma2 family endonuclease